MEINRLWIDILGFHAEHRSRAPKLTALVAVAALHVAAVFAFAQYQPTRQALIQARAVMVSLITPPRLDPPQELPKPKLVARQPIRKIEPLPPPPILAITEPASVPARLEVSLPAPEPKPAVEPASFAVAPAPTPVIPPSFNAGYLKNPAPPYPALSRRLGEEGRVVLRVFVDENGLPARVEVKTSSGFSRLDDVALGTVRTWKFVPARRGEKPVGTWVLVPISFSLRS